MLRCSLFAFLLILASFALYCNAAVHTVTATAGDKWSPSTLTIAVGDSIQFTNLQDGLHTPVALKGSTSDCSGANEDLSLWTPPGAVADFTAGPFNTAKTFNFKCRPHCSIGMTGTITVGSPATTTTTTTTKAPATTTTKSPTTAAGTTTTSKAGTTTTTQTTTSKAGTGTSTTKATSSTIKTTTQSGTGHNDNNGGCFAADSQVRVLTPTNSVVEKQLSQVSRGDMVESFDPNGNPTFSRVYFVAHRNSAASVPLLEVVLSTSNNTASNLKLTANHLVLAASGDFVSAGSLSPGDSLFVREPASTGLKPVRIQSISKAVGPIRTALTANDNIIVSNIAASVFVESVWFYRLVTSPLKFLDAHFPSLLEENSFFSSVIDLLIDLTDFAETHFPRTNLGRHLIVFAKSN